MARNGQAFKKFNERTFMPWCPATVLLILSLGVGFAFMSPDDLEVKFGDANAQPTKVCEVLK